MADARDYIIDIWEGRFGGEWYWGFKHSSDWYCGPFKTRGWARAHAIRRLRKAGFSNPAPEKWHVISHGGNENPIISTDRDYGQYRDLVASVYRPGKVLADAGIKDRADARASMMAAAPAMFDALLGALAYWQRIRKSHPKMKKPDWVFDAEKAISEAVNKRALEKRTKSLVD